MSSKVDMFLQESGGTTFTETAPRPPVPGEENEKESNGGMSTKSSGSHRSQVSQTSCRSMGSTKGDINPATPRKSNIEKPAVSNVTCCFDEEMDAPLGFEPEGSVTNSPPFTENSTPPYLKWAESLQNLLEDHDGVTLFKEFLGQEDVGTASVDFWFACQGLKKNAQITEHSQVVKLMKTISKRYIKGERLPFVDGDTKRTIAEGINLQHEDNIDVTLFDAAQTQVETYMKNETYPLFLNSNLYLSYVSREGDSPKSSNSSIGSNSASRPVSSGPLPTVKEDQELRNDDFAVPFSVGPPTTRHHSRTAPLEAVRPDVLSTPYLSHRSQAVPYHNSYAPVSAQDSEIQSLSSQDTFSEDAQSVTDSSVDGHSYRERRHRMGNRPHRRRPGVPNRENEPIIPRPERLANVKNRNIAETNCKQFAELLSKRLMEVLAERESKERFQEAMNRSDISETMEKTCLSSSSVKNATSTSFGPLLQSSMIDEENADSILEEHCSRIWESSAGQTPSRSPGRSRSPDRFRKPAVPPTGTSSMPGTLHVKTSQSKKRTNSTMSHSLASFDSGMGDDAHKQCVSHKHYHHHHHHHHEKRKTKQKLEWQAQEHSKVCIGDVSTPHHGGRGTRTRSAPRTSSDAYSNLDSGISMVESCQTTQDNSLMADPAKSKVLQWIMDNENMNRGSSSAYTDSDKTSSTQKRSHKSALTPTPQQPYKHSSKKAGSGSHMNRSASADSGSRVPWTTQGVSAMMPSQPIAQDPLMPLMPHPNTRSQLEEVTRRLHGGDTAPVKSKSFTGGMSTKDRRPGMSPSVGSGQEMFMPPPARLAPDMDTSADSTGRRPKRTSGCGNKPEEIRIGYYMFGEPIPYMTTLQQASITLGQFKQQIKRGNFRYFVKTRSMDFDSEAVYEEYKDDHKLLPAYDGKILVKIERKDDLDTSTKSTGSDKLYQL